MTIIIQNFILVSLTSNVTLHPVELPLRAAVLSLPTHLSSYALVSLRTRLPTHSSPYALVSLCTRLLMMARKDGEEGWQGRMTRKDDNISSYALDHLHLTPHCLRSRKVFPAVGTICVSSTCRRNEVIISRASLDGVESERSVGRNCTRSSLVQSSASLSVLVRITG